MSPSDIQTGPRQKGTSQQTAGRARETWPSCGGYRSGLSEVADQRVSSPALPTRFWNEEFIIQQLQRRGSSGASEGRLVAGQRRARPMLVAHGRQNRQCPLWRVCICGHHDSRPGRKPGAGLVSAKVSHDEGAKGISLPAVVVNITGIVASFFLFFFFFVCIPGTARTAGTSRATWMKIPPKCDYVFYIHSFELPCSDRQRIPQTEKDPRRLFIHHAGVRRGGEPRG